MYTSQLSENKLESFTASELKSSDIIAQTADIYAEKMEELDEIFLLHTPMQQKNAGDHVEASPFTDSELSKTDVQKWVDEVKKENVSAFIETTESSEIITPKDGDFEKIAGTCDEMSSTPDSIGIALTKHHNDVTQIKVEEKELKEIDEGSDHKSNKSDISEMNLLDQSIESLFMDPLEITSSNSSIANACDDPNLEDEEIPETQVTIMNVNEDVELTKSGSTLEDLNESCEIPETQLTINGKCSDHITSTIEEEPIVSETSLNSKEEKFSFKDTDDSFTVNAFEEILENNVLNEGADKEQNQSFSKNNMSEVGAQLEIKHIEDDNQSNEDSDEDDSKLRSHFKGVSHFASPDQHFDEYDPNKDGTKASTKLDQQFDKSTINITNKSINVGSTEQNLKTNLNNDAYEDSNEKCSLKKDYVQSEISLADLAYIHNYDNIAENDLKENTTNLLESEDIFEVQSTNSSTEEENGDYEQVHANKNNDKFQNVENQSTTFWDKSTKVLEEDPILDKIETQENSVTVQNRNASITKSYELSISEDITIITSTANEENTCSVMIDQEKLETSQTQNAPVVEIVEKVDNVIEDIANKELCTSTGIEVAMKLNETELCPDYIDVDNSSKIISISERTDIVQQESDTVNSTVSEMRAKNATVRENEEVEKHQDNQKIEKEEKQNKENEEEKIVVNKRVTRKKRIEVQNAAAATDKKAKAKKATQEKEMNADTQNDENNLEEIESNKVVEKRESKEKEVKPKRGVRGRAKKLSLDTNVEQTEDNNKSKVENKKGDTIIIAKRAGRGKRKEIIEADDINETSPSGRENSKPDKTIIVEKRVTRGKRKGHAQDNSLAAKAAAQEGTLSVVQSKAISEDLEVSVGTNKSSADDEETSVLPEENQSILMSSRGRMRKPVAAVQQFIEEVRARSATPKRLKAQQSAFTSTPQSVAKKLQLLSIVEVDLPTMTTDISTVLPETKESILTRRTRRAVIPVTSEEPQLIQNASHTRKARKTANDGKDPLPLEASQSENVSRSQKRSVQQTEIIKEESEPKKIIPRKRGKKNTEESNEKILTDGPVITEDNTTKPTVSKRIRKASVDSVSEPLTSKAKAKENVETTETATKQQKARKTPRTRKVLAKEEELKPELETKLEKTTRGRRGAKNAKKMEDDVTEIPAIVENETTEEKSKPKNSKTKPSEASVVKSTNAVEKSTTPLTRAQRGRKRQISEAPEEESKNAPMDNSNTKKTRQTRGRKIVQFNSDNGVEQEKTEASPPKRVTRARRGM